MNGNEDLDIIASEFPEYTEVFEFLEGDLGLPTLTNEQKYTLGRAIGDAHRAYERPQNTPYHRGELIAAAIQASDQFRQNIDAILADSPLCHLSFLPVTGSRFDINRMMRLQSEVSELKAWLLTAQKSECVSAEIPMGRPSDGGSFLLLVLNLRDGWKRALGKEATTSSSNRGKTMRFRDKDINTGTRGGIFPYFVYIIESMVGSPEIVSQYGDKVESALKTIKRFDKAPTDNTVIAPLKQDD